MKFDTPAATNPIDRLAVVGKPLDRIDGPLKTTGRAPYAYEHHGAAPDQAHGVVVPATIAKGRLRRLDTSGAANAPGVVAVVTAETAGPLGKGEHNTATLLGGPEIKHYHQAIALVVADTFEQARAAAALVTVEYEPEQGAFDLAGDRDRAEKPGKVNDSPPDTAVGDFDGAFGKAEVRLDETYTTPGESHAMMEPHASLAFWEGSKLTLYTSTQMVAWTKKDLAKTLKIEPDDVHVVSPFIGGGFGGKLFLRADALLAALGARAAGRPVKVALQRPMMFNNTTHRPATIQRIRIGAGRDGVITAIGHESWSADLDGGKPDGAVDQTRMLYAAANRMTATRLETLDLPESNSMRAPGEATGMMALEIAMDEMAEKLGIDPVEFRIRNDTQVVPDDPKAEKSGAEAGQRRFSHRPFVECLRLGAERFGWSRRNAKPAATREEGWLIGHGMAAAFRNNMSVKSAARVRLDAQGQVVVETDMTDIGTGSYTIIAQTAAEMMGVPLDRVTVRLGDSSFPVSAGSGGQFGGNCSTAGVFAACVKLREAVSGKLGFNQADLTFADGQVSAGGRSVALTEAVRDGELVGEDGIEFGEISKTYQQSTFGSHFVEVAVDAWTGEIRVRRMLAVCASGRILNPKTARSQVIGAMTMGVGAALLEELVVDKRAGFFVNHDLAQYEVPVHADIPHQEVIFLDETDPMSSPMKAKGIAELGICGLAAAVANAVYNATGVRVRDYPITLDKLIGRMPDAA
jgi:xanthine dehydrogenase YagR molybdenum-binding subunit